MQIDHKIAVIKMLRKIQENYQLTPGERQKWVDFEQKVSHEMDSYSLSHKLAVFKTVSLFLRSIERIQAAKTMVGELNTIIKR